jgi:glycosyltransferase involved in cell wall biosynthesis
VFTRLGDTSGLHLRFFYVDPGLQNNLGHHANSCRLVKDGLNALGIETITLAYKDVAFELQAELRAVPHFRAFTYWFSDGDPVRGWLNAFNVSSAWTYQDLARLDVGVGDFVYFHSAQPAQVMAAMQWIITLSPKNRPRVVVEFGTEPGLQVKRASNSVRFETPDPRVDPRPTLFRLVGERLREIEEHCIDFATFHSITSRAYESMLGQRVGVLPFPYQAKKSVSDRSQKRPIVIAALGHQGPDKGFHLLPSIAEELLRTHADIRIVLHNAVPGEMPEPDAALRTLARRDKRLTFYEGILGGETWESLLTASDLILCPYNPERYSLSHSGIVAEAIANGIPVVVPSGTALASITEEFGGAQTTFDRFDVPSIVEATSRALSSFGHYATLAGSAARKWRQTQGARRMLDTMLELTEPRMDTH